MLIRLIEWILEVILNYRMAEKNLRTAMNQHNGRPQVTMMQAFVRGEYQHALAISAAAQHGVNVGVFDGALLMQIGRLNEAERMVSQALTSETEPRSTALAHCVLGDVYVFHANMTRRFLVTTAL